MSMLYAIVTSPLSPDTVEFHGHADELLTILLDVFGYAVMETHLGELIDYLYHFVGNDLTYDTFLFPFLLKVLVVGERDHSEQLRTFSKSLSQFIPSLENIVFAYSEYVDADVPKADKEFGSLGDAFSARSPESYTLVTVDSGQAERKAVALDTLIHLYEMQAHEETLEDVKKDHMESMLVSLCQHSSVTIRHHAVGPESASHAVQGDHRADPDPPLRGDARLWNHRSVLLPLPPRILPEARCGTHWS